MSNLFYISFLNKYFGALYGFQKYFFKSINSKTHGKAVHKTAKVVEIERDIVDRANCLSLPMDV